MAAKKKVSKKKAKKKTAKNKGGRPTKYNKEHYPRMAYKAARLGATNGDLAELFGVAISTVQKWGNEWPEFSAAIKEAKQDMNESVERSLLERAMGYKHKEDKIFNNNGEPMIVETMKHYPPDSTAMIFWLKNRDPERWRDKREADESEDLAGALSKLADKLPG